MLRRTESGIAGRGLNADYIYWIKDRADELGLNGTIFFKNDGSIKVIAEGEEEYLEEFIDKLSKAQIFHVIDNFYTTWLAPQAEFHDFYIKENDL